MKEDPQKIRTIRLYLTERHYQVLKQVRHLNMSAWLRRKIEEDFGNEEEILRREIEDKEQEIQSFRESLKNLRETKALAERNRIGSLREIGRQKLIETLTDLKRSGTKSLKFVRSDLLRYEELYYLTKEEIGELATQYFGGGHSI